MKKRLQLILFIFIIIAIIGVGCGKKAPPIPPKEISNFKFYNGGFI